MKYFEELKKSMNYLSQNRKTIFIGQAVSVPGTAMSTTLVDIKNLFPLFANVDFIYNKNQKYFADYSGTFFATGERVRTAYAIRLNQSWDKKGIKYDYYVGGTGKHPAIRYLEHLIPERESNLKRGKSMKFLDEFLVKKGSKDSIQYELESKLAIKYCKKGFYVYSDQHMCKKCR